MESKSRETIPRWSRIAILMLGIATGQAILYGPSLIGRRILLPIDLLAAQGWYLPQTPQTRAIVPHDFIISDQILLMEPQRRFTAAEWRAGRLPMWAPHSDPVTWVGKTST